MIKESMDAIKAAEDKAMTLIDKANEEAFEKVEQAKQQAASDKEKASQQQKELLVAEVNTAEIKGKEYADEIKEKMKLKKKEIISNVKHKEKEAVNLAVEKIINI